MTWLALGLFLGGLLLSAFFSGSETGFYRVPRIRLLIDSLAGDRTSRGLLWLTNYPSLFVATTLIGNNLANYMTSAAIVLATSHLVHGSVTAELCAPILIAPILFVYGELLPKNLFYHAPTALLRACSPVFLLFTLLFLPVSCVLWALSKVLEWFAGESPQRLQRRLARKELALVLDEGHVAGLLRPSQRTMAKGIFAVANQPVTEFITPLDQLPAINCDASKDALLRVAREHDLAAIPVRSEDSGRELSGYVFVPDLYLDTANEVGELRSLIDIPSTWTHLAALMQMQASDETLARVVDREGMTVGIVTNEQLSEPLFRGGQRDSAN
jgi:CBS domain containing-hemolysin-like protein